MRWLFQRLKHHTYNFMVDVALKVGIFQCTGRVAISWISRIINLGYSRSASAIRWL
jgi:hypothetical protein